MTMLCPLFSMRPDEPRRFGANYFTRRLGDPRAERPGARTPTRSRAPAPGRRARRSPRQKLGRRFSAPGRREAAHPLARRLRVVLLGVGGVDRVEEALAPDRPGANGNLAAGNRDRPAGLLEKRPAPARRLVVPRTNEHPISHHDEPDPRESTRLGAGPDAENPGVAQKRKRTRRKTAASAESHFSVANQTSDSI